METELRQPGVFLSRAPTNTTMNLALFLTQPWTVFRGTCNSSGIASAAGLVTPYFRTGPTAYTSSAQTVTAFNALDGTVNGSANVWCVWQDYIDSLGDGLWHSGWAIIQSDC